ncbi:lysylphosphatidylglycerol synthase transmembrane domain-containing protein [Halosolutus gelatinilyticus]|uniref:lysylphosphatidylglycerol synthase transmembrane domain-containing protein n=1 Tax=Halosolutus gelatinilyticus TaxID=2931975 RepID=UPI001FF269FC|nr:lysylphosphatidylglycerol synthase transmembrane domain-containing protein [Halosolutus gelatinilyticus]
MSGLDRARTVVRRHGLWLTAILTVAIFFGLFAFGEADAVSEAILSLERWRIGTVFALVTVGYGVRFLKWEYYLRELGVDVPIGTSLLVFISGLMMTVTPGKAGEVWKAWFLRDLRGVSVNRTASVVGAERVTDLLALAAFAFLGAAVYEQSPTTLLVVTAIFLGGLALLRWRTACLRILGGLESVPLVGAYADDVREFYENSYALLRPRPLVVAVSISLVAWGLEGVALWIVLDGFAPGGSVLLALFVFGLGSIVGAASLLPGGLAATEASMVGTLVVLGYSRTVAVSATLVIRVGTLWYGAALGTTVFVCYRYLRERRESAEALR